MHGYGQVLHHAADRRSQGRKLSLALRLGELARRLGGVPFRLRQVGIGIAPELRFDLRRSTSTASAANAASLRFLSSTTQSCCFSTGSCCCW